MTIIDGETLEPCPFCRCDDLRLESEEWKPKKCIVCLNIDCNATGPLDLGRSGAIDKWNERRQ